MSDVVELSIGGQPVVLRVKEYGGQRVLITRDIEKTNRQYWGAASKTLQADRERFVEGKHYFFLTGVRAYKYAVAHSIGTNPSRVRQLFLITEAGYLLLAESFTGDLAQEAKRQVVERYFRGNTTPRIIPEADDAPRQIAPTVETTATDKQIEKVFDYQGFKVRTVVINGEPWFVAADVCQILNVDTSTSVNGRWQTREDGTRYRDNGLAEDDKGTATISTPGGPQKLLIVSEGGLYALILKSRVQAAIEFQRWLTHEVIPSIRKDGMYVTPELLFNPDHLLQVTQRLRDEYVARVAAEAKVEQLAPGAEKWDKLSACDDTQSMEAAAKSLGWGRNKLFAWLREEGILMSNNRPYQRYIEAGYFKVRESIYTDSFGIDHLNTTTLVTGKGIAWLLMRLHPGA